MQNSTFLALLRPIFLVKAKTPRPSPQLKLACRKCLFEIGLKVSLDINSGRPFFFVLHLQNSPPQLQIPGEATDWDFALVPKTQFFVKT